jgi:cytochrome b561
MDPPPALPEGTGGTVRGLSHFVHMAMYALVLAQPVIVWWALWAGGITDWPFRRRTH